MSERSECYLEVANILTQMSQDSRIFLMNNRQLLLAISMALIQLANKEKQQ